MGGTPKSSKSLNYFRIEIYGDMGIPQFKKKKQWVAAMAPQALWEDHCSCTRFRVSLIVQRCRYLEQSRRQDWDKM